MAQDQMIAQEIAVRSRKLHSGAYPQDSLTPCIFNAESIFLHNFNEDVY